MKLAWSHHVISLNFGKYVIIDISETVQDRDVVSTGHSDI